SLRRSLRAARDHAGHGPAAGRAERDARRAELEARAERALGDARAIAALGVAGAGAGGPLPFGPALQASFGRHDLSGVRAHVGGAAGEAARALGARAYTLGEDLAFDGAPSLELVAHEAAHVVQQRAGV